MDESQGPPSSYQGLDEQLGRLTPAEERFERGRRSVGLVAGPLLFLILYLAPFDMPRPQQSLAAIFGFVMVFWISEAIPIPMTALLGVVLCVALGVADGDEVFAAFSNGTIFLFVGAFIIARAMTVHGLDRRFAFRVLSLPGVAASTHRTIVTFGAIGALLSAFISNTATTAMLFPIGVGMIAALSALLREGSSEEVDPTRPRFGTALMLMIAYGSSVGGLLTPIGSPPNLIGRALIEEQTGVTIGFLDWMVMAFPIVLAMFVALAFILVLLNRPEVRRLQGIEEYVRAQREGLGPLSTGERNTVIAFVVAVALWILPGAIGLMAGDDSDLYATVSSRLEEGVVAILAASLLFVLPIDWQRRRFTLHWGDAASIDWGTILLFGGGIVLGTMLESTGLAERIGHSISDSFGFSSLLPITIVGSVIAVLISETTSNTASATVVVPIVIPIAQTAGVDPVVPALAAVLAASYGFMLPVSTPPNAIVYGSGMIPITKMIRSGVVFDVVGLILVITGVTVMTAVIGLR